MSPACKGEADEHMGYPLLLALISGLAFGLAFVLCAPVPCEKDPECHAEVQGRPRHYNSYCAWLLLVLLLHELAALPPSRRGSRQLTKMVDKLHNRFLPSVLLSVCFAVLGLEQCHYAFSDNVFAHASSSLNVPRLRGFDLDVAGRPVYTIMYLEWTIAVPCLLGLSGYCALGRPLKEMVAPVLATNVYIILCWASLLVSSMLLRWTLIAVSFGMYAWASCLMMKWVSAFNGTAPSDFPSRAIRPWLTECIIVLFFVYGIVFLLAATGSITSTTENTWYTFLNVGTKLAMSIAFVAIRGNEYHESLTNVLTKMNNSNMGMVSILRGSFDLILPCRATLTGDCCFSLESTTDMRKLETVLGRTLVGVSLVDLVAGQSAKDDFRSHIKNTLRQASSETTLENACLMSSCVWNRAGKEVVPPVAQVVHCRLLRATSGHSTDAAFQNAMLKDVKTVAACIHTSVVPDSAAAISFSSDATLIVAIQLISGEGEHEESERCFDRNASQLATLNVIESTTHDTDATSHSALSAAPSQPFPKFVGNLADLTLMGIDFVANSWSHSQSDTSSCPKPSITNPQTVQSEETTESERAVSLLTSSRHSHAPPGSSMKQTAVESNIDCNIDIGVSFSRSAQKNWMPSYEFGLPPAQRFLTDADKERDEEPIVISCHWRPTWAHTILVSITAATAGVAAMAAIRSRCRKI